LYIKAPTGMGYYQVSSAPNSSYDGEGDPNETIHSSTHVTFVDSDDEEDAASGAVLQNDDDLSATSSDDESSDEEEQEEQKEHNKQHELEEVDWDAWLKD
jgi:hypothetical protein